MLACIHAEQGHVCAGNEGEEGNEGDEGDEGNEGEEGNEGNEGDEGNEGEEGNEGNEGDEGNEGEEGNEGNEGVKCAPTPLHATCDLQAHIDIWLCSRLKSQACNVDYLQKPDNECHMKKSKMAWYHQGKEQHKKPRIATIIPTFAHMHPHAHAHAHTRSHA